MRTTIRLADSLLLETKRTGGGQVRHCAMGVYGRKVTLIVIRVSTGTPCSSVGS